MRHEVIHFNYESNFAPRWRPIISDWYASGDGSGLAGVVGGDRRTLESIERTMTTDTIITRPRFQWRVLGLLGILNVIVSILVLPYAIALQSPGASPTPIQFLIVTAAQVISTLVINVPLAALGLFLGSRLGLGAPLLAAWTGGEPPPHRPGFVLAMGLGLGALTGGVILFLAYVVFEPIVRADLISRGLAAPDIPLPTAWQGFWASISAAVTEETLLRLFLLTLLAWLGSRVRRTPEGRLTPGVAWTANVLTSLAFGALHLPLASSLMPLTPWVVTQVLVLNGLGGLVFGWLYWKYGLESAMLAHFSADLILHVIPPLVGSG
jgi:hypothetical protein